MDVVLLVVVTAVVVVFVLSSANAALYYCTDSTGQQILTDIPAQLSHCDVVPSNRSSSSAPAAPSDQPAPPLLSAPTPNGLPSEGNDVTQPVLPARTVTVPIQRMGPLFIVTTRLNQTRDARLILDTGASLTVLSHQVALDLALFSDARTTTVTLQTVGGSVQADLARIESIRVAEAEVRNSIAAIHDLPDAPPGVDGLLGLSFLHQFEVTLDTVKGQLHLGRRQDEPTHRIGEGKGE